MAEKETNTMNPKVSNQETENGITALNGKYDHLTPEEIMEMIRNKPAPVVMTGPVVSG